MLRTCNLPNSSGLNTYKYLRSVFRTRDYVRKEKIQKKRVCQTFEIFIFSPVIKLLLARAINITTRHSAGFQTVSPTVASAERDRRRSFRLCSLILRQSLPFRKKYKKKKQFFYIRRRSDTLFKRHLSAENLQARPRVAGSWLAFVS